MRIGNDLHIISFDVPYPPNYGGVIDVFYRIKALSAIGVRVHLHTYVYGRPASGELEKYCYKVHYYKRHLYKDPFFSRLPYIVATRNSTELLENLLKDDFPILMEGIHCCYYLTHPALRQRFKIVRMHNIEHIYYKNLAKIEKNIFKKYFFSREAERLRAFQPSLHHADAIAAISPDDEKSLGLKFGNVFFLPPFHANSDVDSGNEEMDFAFYHGNLGVGENNEAALYLVNEVFNDIDYPLVIAGNNPTAELKEAVAGKKNISLLANISTAEIFNLIRKAKMNVLPTFQSTGMKLKLVNVLFQGRYCIVNRKMVHNTGLEELCIMANSALEMKKAVLRTASITFCEEEVEKRRAYLDEHFNNHKNARLLVEQVFQPSISVRA